jgi:glucokinase
VTELRAGVDVGGTTTKACLLDEQGTISAHLAVPTNVDVPGALGDHVVRTLDTLVVEAGLRLSDLVSIGIGVPGEVDQGSVSLTVNLGIGQEGFDLGGYVSSATQVPARVENDVRAAAYGAYAISNAAGLDISSLVFVGIGTGVSAGLVVDGTIYRGSRGLAGEFGHVPVGTRHRCTCGSVGCLETVIGAAAIQRIWGGDRAGDLFAEAGDGDRRAMKLASEATTYLANAMWWLAAAYDPEVFYIGGGIGASTPFLRDEVARQWAEMSQASAFARRVLDPDRIRRYDLIEPVGAYGAALLGAHADAVGREKQVS